MNTVSKNNQSVLSPEEDEYEIALDNLEFAFSKKELKYIQKSHNNGVWFVDIGEEIKRDPYEVLIAIMHMLRKGMKIDPLKLY